MPDITSSPVFSVSVAGVSIGARSNCQVPSGERARIPWMQALPVRVEPIKGTSISPEQAVVWLVPEDDHIDFREKAPETAAGAITLKIKPQMLGFACLRLKIIKEPGDRNQDLFYPFQLVPPFALPHRTGNMILVNPKIERPELKTIMDFAKERYSADLGSSNQAANQASKDSIRGMWVTGPLGCGKSVLFGELKLAFPKYGFGEINGAACRALVVDISFAELLSIESNDRLQPGGTRTVEEQVEERINKKIMGVVKDYFHTLYPNPLPSWRESDGQLTRLKEWLLVPKEPLFLLFVLDEFDRFHTCDQARAQKALSYLTDVVSFVFGGPTNPTKLPQCTAVLVVGDYMTARDRLGQQAAESFWQPLEMKLFTSDQIKELMLKVFDSPTKALDPRELHRMTAGDPLLISTVLTLYLEYERKPGDTSRTVKDIVQTALQDQKGKANLREVVRWLVRQASVRPEGGSPLADRLNNPERQYLKKLVQRLPCQDTPEAILKSLRAKGFLSQRETRIRSQLLFDLLSHFSDLL